MLRLGERRLVLEELRDLKQKIEKYGSKSWLENKVIFTDQRILIFELMIKRMEAINIFFTIYIQYELCTLWFI